ncbi:peptidase M16, partial [bacterium]|nr:peptidase M16 [bacterium]
LLDQLELQQREISGDSYPYGLQLMLSALPSAMHRHDPAAALDIEPVLKRLRSEIGEPNFVSKLVYDKLLNNQHRVILSLEPDSHLAEQMREQEQARLAEIQSSLTQVEKQAIVDTAKALEERQNQSDDPEVLPTITLDDVPAAIEAPKFVETKQEQRRLRFYPTGTNGLVYMQAFVRLPELSADSIGLLPLHNRLLTELGLGDSDYLSTQDRQSAVCGGIHAFSSFKGAADDVFNLSGYAGLSCKGLAHKADALQALMQDTLQDVRFDELPRIKDIVAQSRARAERSVSGNGHGLAMQIAAQGYSPAAAIAHHSNGIAGIRHLKSIDESLKDSAALNDFAGSLAALHAQLVSPSDVLLVAEQQHENLLESLMTRWDKSNTLSASRLSSKLQQSQSTRELWVANTQVNFCAIAYPTVPPTHRDAAALTVLAGVLRNGFLHTAIREKGGAYGGGASHDSANGIFRFYSYRDPRLGETLDDFRASIAWLLNTDIDDRLVTEAILGVIGSLDKPASPAGTAKEHFRHALFGFTDDMRAAFRSQVLSTTKADLLAVAERYLSQDDFSIGIVTHAGESERYTALAEQNDIRIVNL